MCLRFYICHASAVMCQIALCKIHTACHQDRLVGDRSKINFKFQIISIWYSLQICTFLSIFRVFIARLSKRCNWSFGGIFGSGQQRIPLHYIQNSWNSLGIRSTICCERLESSKLKFLQWFQTELSDSEKIFLKIVWRYFWEFFEWLHFL